MFTDDTNLFISDSNIGNLFEKVANWFKANKFSLNISKIKYSLFNSARKRKDMYTKYFTSIAH